MPIGLGDIVGQIGTGVYRLIKGKDVNIKAGANVTPSPDGNYDDVTVNDITIADGDLILVDDVDVSFPDPEPGSSGNVTGGGGQASTKTTSFASVFAWIQTKLFGAATSIDDGTAGVVPAPSAGEQNYFLRGDATWAVPTNTEYSAGNNGLVPAAGNSGEFLQHDGTFGTPSYNTLQIGTTSGTALAGDTALLQLGTTSTTALAGDTALLQLGTSSTTALAGDTSIPSGNQIIDWTTDQGSTNINTGNYNNTTYSVSCVDGDDTDEVKIRLNGTDSSTDDVVLEAGTGLSISRSVDKITFTNTVTDTDTILTTEQVQDIVGAMFSGNTETRVAATYVDGGVGAGKINIVVDDMTTDINTQRPLINSGVMTGASSTNVASAASIKTYVDNNYTVHMHTHFYISSSSNNSFSTRHIPFYGQTTASTSTSSSGNFFVAAHDGSVKSILYRHSRGNLSYTRTLKMFKNTSTSATGTQKQVTNYAGGYTNNNEAKVTCTDWTFDQGDRIRITMNDTTHTYNNVMVIEVEYNKSTG